jgi:Uncharacterized conserved protein
MKKLSTHDLCLTGVFTAIIIVLGQFSIPMPYGVPMTLQTFVIPFAGIVLGAKRGALATLAYVLLGAVGLPVFAGFTGGINIVFGPTGGFILSFPIMAWFAGKLAEKDHILWIFAGLTTGTLLNFLCGMLMFSLITANSLATAFLACVLPFIPTAIMKIILSAILGRSVKKLLIKGKLLA